MVHKNQVLETLLHHANELIRFEEFISNLPPTLSLKILCHALIYVYNLPANNGGKSVSNKLHRVSDKWWQSAEHHWLQHRPLLPDPGESNTGPEIMENEDCVIHFPNPRSSVTLGALVPSIKAKSPKKLKNVKLCRNKDVCEPVPSTKAVSG